MDGLEELRIQLGACGAKRFKVITGSLARAADPAWTGDRSCVDQIVATVLWQLHKQPFEPGRDTAFWQSASGQILASALYNTHRDDLIKPVDAARILFAGASNPIAVMRDWVRAGRVHAFPRPEWSKNKKTPYQRQRRGSAAHVCWMVSRTEVENLARSRQLRLASTEAAR